jgi:YHS domain-containing protein
MFRFILFVVLILALYYVLHILIRDMSSIRKKMKGMADPEELVQDPYCQTYVPKRTAVKGKVAGRRYYFCSRKCFEGFLKRNTP